MYTTLKKQADNLCNLLLLIKSWRTNIITCMATMSTYTESLKGK